MLDGTRIAIVGIGNIGRILLARRGRPTYPPGTSSYVMPIPTALRPPGTSTACVSPAWQTLRCARSTCFCWHHRPMLSQRSWRPWRHGCARARLWSRWQQPCP